MLNGSLRSMTYLKPKYMKDKFLNWFKKTQVATIEEQYEKYNVRVFDFHIYFIGPHMQAVFKYGNIVYDTFSIFQILSYLNTRGDTYVRVVLEETECRDKSEDAMVKMACRFYDYCNTIEVIYPEIMFFGGYRECDSRKLYFFRGEMPDNTVFYKRVDKIINK